MASRETENNAYAKFWGDKQRALWYVMVFLEWSIGPFFLSLLQNPPSLGEEERNSCSQKITALMFSRQNLVHALVKISFARGSCFYSFLYIKLTKKFVHERRYLIRKINFFYVFSIARTRKVLRKNICFKWEKTSAQIGMNECLVSLC